MSESFKCVVVGDGAVGKSCMLITYTTKSYPSDYVPTVFDNYIADIKYKNTIVQMALWDTAGQEDYDRLRPLSYYGSNVFLMCFSVVNRTSLENIKTKWIPEIVHHCPLVPIVLVGTKIDLRNDEKYKNDYVSTEEAQRFAKDIPCIACYVECSSRTQQGLEDTFNAAVEAAFMYKNMDKKKLKKMRSRMLLLPPQLPKAEKAPWINIETSHFGEEWGSMLNKESISDVQFFVEDRIIYAHKVILCSASNLFCKIFGIEGTNQQMNIPKSIIEIKNEDEICFIKLDKNIKYEIFYKIIEFLYTGMASFKNNNDCVKEVMNLAPEFECNDLVTFCQNILDGNEFLNPSIGTWLNDCSGERAKKLFLFKDVLSDVQFQVEDSLIPAHKALITCRCQVLQAMLTENFMENRQKEIKIEEVTKLVFESFLEYLYTDHTEITEENSVGLLVLANQMGMSRLVTLCELYISKIVENATRDSIDKADIDVVELLHVAQTHNAQQLAKFCLHFISVNYQPMKKRKEFKNLSGENLKYVTENQWPPKWYLTELEKYEKKKKKLDEKGKCNLM